MHLAPLESLLNRNIAASAAARAACQRLAGKTLTVNIVSSPQNILLSLHFHCANERMSISTKNDLPADATLSGTPLAYLSMVRSQPETVMRTGAIRIEGNAEIAQTFRDLLAAAKPDLEEELSRVFGDVAAHQVGNFARGALAFGRRVADTFTQNLSEYLQEESRDIVTRIEVDEFIQAIDKLRDDVERAEARINNLLAIAKTMAGR